MADYNSSYTGPQIDTAVGAALYPDSTPTSGSTKLATSGGIYTALRGATSLISAAKDVSTANTSATLSVSMNNFNYLVLIGHAGGTGAQQNFVLIVPVLTLGSTARWYAIATSAGAGGVRLSGSDTTLTFVGSTYSSLQIDGIYGKN